MGASESILEALRERLSRPPPLGAEEADREIVCTALSRLPASGPVMDLLRAAARQADARAALLSIVLDMMAAAAPDLAGDRAVAAAVFTLSPAGLDARELAPGLRSLIGDREASEGLRLGAAALTLAFEPKEPASIAFSVTYLDELIARADCKKAFVRAAKTYAEGPHRLPEAPATRGNRRARASDSLCFEPYGYRRTMEDVLAALGRAARTDRRVIPWLFEGAKIWSVERERALVALREANPGDDELRAGLGELVRHAASKPSRDRAGVIRSVLEVGDARWLALCLEALEPEPALCEVVAERVIRAPNPVEEIDPWSRALRRLANDASQPLVRVMAFLAAGGSEASAAAVLDATPATLVPVVTQRLVEQRLFGPAIASAVKRARSRLDPDEDLEAIAWNCRRAARVETSELLPGAELEEPRALGSSLVAAYHQIHALVPPSEWSNDEDEVGVIVIDPDGAVARRRLPMTLPIARNGANYAKRRLDVECVHEGELFVTVQCPFSDQRGWGTEVYLWSFRPPDRWRWWTREDGELISGAKSEAARPVCYGELVIWRDETGLRFEIDGTPYHLDDWTHTGEVARALDARSFARAAGETLPSSRRVTWADLDVARPSGAPELDTVWAGTWSGREVVLASCRRQRWPELALVLVRPRD